MCVGYYFGCTRPTTDQLARMQSDLSLTISEVAAAEKKRDEEMTKFEAEEKREMDTGSNAGTAELQDAAAIRRHTYCGLHSLSRPGKKCKMSLHFAPRAPLSIQICAHSRKRI